MADKKRRVYVQDDEQDLDSEGQPRQDLLDKFVGDVAGSTGYEERDAPKETPPEKALVYPQQNGRILAGPPKEAEVVPPGSKDFVRFYDDTTDGPNFSNEQKIALAAIGLLSPIIGGALGGKQGAYAGAASGAKGIGDALKGEDDYYKKIKAAKFANKSRVMTAMELKELKGGKDGAAAADGKVKYEWKMGIGPDGRPVWNRFNKVTGEVDKSLDNEAYTNTWFKRRPKGLSPADTVTDDDGAVMPNPKRKAQPEQNVPAAGGGDPAGLGASNDQTFNYDDETPAAKPANVPATLPATTGTQPATGETRGKISPDEGKQTASYLAQQHMAELDSMMPDDRDFDPTRKDGESYADAEARVKQAIAQKKQVIDKKEALKKDLLDAQQEIEKEDRGEERAKRLAEFRHNLDKDMATFKQGIKPAGKAATPRRQVMKNAKGQLVDVQTGEIVDSNTTPEKASGGASGSGGKTAAQEQKIQDKVSEFDQAIADMQDVLDRVGDHSNWVGVVDGRLATANSDEAKFRSAIGMMNDSYRKMITGVGAGDKELRTLASRLPSEKDVSLDVFKGKADQYIKKVVRQKKIYLQDHGKSESDFAGPLQANLDQQKSQLVPPKDGMVLFQAPDGNKAWIPKDRVDYYQKKAGGNGKVLQGGN